jgi:hypothetical protein|nr:hypothetical protein [Methanoculleus marisnigri]
MAPYTMKGPLLPLMERDFQEPGKFLVAGTAVLAALIVEPPGTNLILWLLLFISAGLAGQSGKTPCASWGMGAEPLRPAIPMPPHPISL